MNSVTINTKRLHLRLLKKNDLNYLIELNSDPEVRHFFPTGTQTKEQAKTRMDEKISYYNEHGIPNFLIFLNESTEFVGTCGFGLIETGEIEVGYVLHKKFWGKGYASEALAGLLKWAKKNIQADYIIAFSPEHHVASQRVMQKCGMQYYKKDKAYEVTCDFYRIAM